MNAFSIRLKQAMDKAHMKQVDLCNATGILKSLISGYVNGNFYPKMDNLTLIAKALNVTSKWLLFGDESEDQHENRSEIFITLDGKLLRSTVTAETVNINADKITSNEKEEVQMNEYLKALEGISYSEWTRLKTAVDRSFDMKLKELETDIKMPDADQIRKLMDSQFGSTPVGKMKEAFTECVTGKLMR